MGRILLIPVFLFGLAYAQEKNDNTIIVKGVSFEQVVNALLDSGYHIEKMDKEYRTIKTEYRELCDNCLPQLYFDIRVKDSTATISGKWRSNLNGIFGLKTERDNNSAYIFPIKNEKDKVPKKCFNKMNDFAKSLNGQITYAKL
jgi:hypothetical protein